ncbi:hypothetical protein D5R81_00840 [Parashewanella spongiae]|uniref:Uncharacterized protein n=1 Tax=Parashewanella spongiae TaxID=342950 RepID=A0A3A6U1U3_9GAMM|nr:hypothetical protein [Parashewanella spongiae]MCL1078693.1 hypothetical protein [Parashewanella spongiae]RJY19398.1 hypothetical protein D5R81_00840 [Parashewanella spongiae]
MATASADSQLIPIVWLTSENSGRDPYPYIKSNDIINIRTESSEFWKDVEFSVEVKNPTTRISESIKYVVEIKRIGVVNHCAKFHVRNKQADLSKPIQLNEKIGDTYSVSKDEQHRSAKHCTFFRSCCVCFGGQQTSDQKNDVKRERKKVDISNSESIREYLPEKIKYLLDNYRNSMTLDNQKVEQKTLRGSSYEINLR